MSTGGGAVLIVGGGPAGAAAAISLARAGRRVFLFEKGGEERDKVCGDAMLPGAQRPLMRLGVFDDIRKEALRLTGFTVYAKDNVKFRLPCAFYTLQRTRLDRMLRDKASELGAQVLCNVEIKDVRTAHGGVVLTDTAGRNYEGDCVIMATGSDIRLSQELGFKSGCDASISMRAYAENNLGVDSSILWFAETLRAGFGWGWIFPVPGGLLNVGVFVDRNEEVNLAGFFRLFARSVERLSRRKINFVTKPHGWALRKGLARGGCSAERVLLAGENIHTAYNFTGEGIGTALRSGILAAETIINAESNYSAGALASYDLMIRREFSSAHLGFARGVRIARNRYAFGILTRLFARSATLRRAGGRLISDDIDPSKLLSVSGLADIIFA